MEVGIATIGLGEIPRQTTHLITLFAVSNVTTHPSMANAQITVMLLLLLLLLLSLLVLLLRLLLLLLFMPTGTSFPGDRKLAKCRSVSGMVTTGTQKQSTSYYYYYYYYY